MAYLKTLVGAMAWRNIRIRLDWGRERTVVLFSHSGYALVITLFLLRSSTIWHDFKRVQIADLSKEKKNAVLIALFIRVTPCQECFN